MRAGCVIVGGGISGPAAAHELQRQGVPFGLVEGAARFGGLIRTEHVDGFVVDAGPVRCSRRSARGSRSARSLALRCHRLDPRGHFSPIAADYARYPTRLCLASPQTGNRLRVRAPCPLWENSAWQGNISSRPRYCRLCGRCAGAGAHRDRICTLQGKSPCACCRRLMEPTAAHDADLQSRHAAHR